MLQLPIMTQIAIRVSAQDAQCDGHCAEHGHSDAERQADRLHLLHRKLCAVMVDTLGREVMVVRQIELDDHGWPKHGTDTFIKSGSEVDWLRLPSPWMGMSDAMVDSRGYQLACLARRCSQTCTVNIGRNFSRGKATRSSACRI